MPGMKTILVVDDEPSVLFALSESLTDKRRGVRVATAANGVEAVAVLESEPVDLVLTDLRMPDMDGFELLTFLRRNHAALPVILMTALGSAETSARLATAGSFECLPKPFNLPDLKRKIAEMLAQRVKGRVENISLASFLQLLEMERKTCTLSVRSPIPTPTARGSSTSAPAGWWERRAARRAAARRPWRSSPGSTPTSRSRTAARPSIPRSTSP